MATWAETMTATERQQLLAQLTTMKRLVTGTLVPHLDRDPDSVEARAIMAQLEGLAAMIEDALHRETQTEPPPAAWP